MAAQSPSEEASIPSKPSLPRRIWAKIKAEQGVLKTMFKAACPPTIALAISQYDGVVRVFPTLSYLVAISSILSMALLPRSKFFQTIMFNILGISIGSCIALLSCYCAIQARLHTSPAVTSTGSIGVSGSRQAVEYNPSASTVAAIWLFFNIGCANALRFSRPQLQLPVILYSIFANISGTFAPTFGSMDQAIAFVKQLMEAFFAGMGIAMVVNLIIFPKSARSTVFAQFQKYNESLRSVIILQRDYLRSMEESPSAGSLKDDIQGQEVKTRDAASKLTGGITGLTASHAKLASELIFAKREVAYGKLDAKDIDRMFNLHRQVFLPLLGLGSVVDIFERLIDKQKREEANGGLDISSTEPPKLVVPTRSTTGMSGWSELMQSLHDPFSFMCDAIIDGLIHASYTLELSKKPKAQRATSDVKDVEKDAASPQPGDSNFGAFLENKIKEFSESRQRALHTWCSLKGMEIPSQDIQENASLLSNQFRSVTSVEHNRQQLYLVLYVEFLLGSIANSVLNLIQFADDKVASGVMKKKRIIHPGQRRLKKWLIDSFKFEDASAEHTPDSAEAGFESVYLGDAFKVKKDPEHLPPANAWEKFGDAVRRVPRTLRSTEVAFGFRVACATMTIAIVAFLEQTQRFFIEQRLVWAMIMVSIGMTMTAGSGVFGLMGRVVGTAFAAILAMVIWYIAGGSGVPGGVIPVLFVAAFVQYYFFIKYPRFTISFLIVIVTEFMIVGYELGVAKIGVAASQVSGQVYYPIYIMAPYRLATVIVGCFVAFLFTYFPYPLSTRSTLRSQLGQSLYLLANYYNVVHATVQMRVSGTGGDPTSKTSPSARLEKANKRLVSKLLSLIEQLRQHLLFLPYDFSLGGKFPQTQYETLVPEIHKLLRYMSLISYSTQIYTLPPATESEENWIRDLASISDEVTITSEDITSLLSLVASSIINGCPLPPYLKPPPSYHLSAMLEKLDPEILSVRHVTEPGYAAFAVTQVASQLINDDLRRLLGSAKQLIGEIDFSFRVVGTRHGSREGVEGVGAGNGKGKRE